MTVMLTFEDALAQALDRCNLGESPGEVAAAFPDHDLLPYLDLAERLRVARASEPSTDWMQRSLQRLVGRQRR
jgi:hypothetical protein